MSHAALSPSGSQKWLACAGAPVMEQGYPDVPSEYSDEGTCAHAVAAMCLAENKPALAYVGRRINVGPCRTYEFREDMVEPVQCYVGWVTGQRDLYLTLAGEVVTLYETAVPLAHITGEESATGTADVILVAPAAKELVVADLKFGRGVQVTAAGNPQLRLYALGALELLREHTIETVRLVVHQPRVSAEPSEETLTVAELTEWGLRASDRAAHALNLLRAEKPGAYVHHLTPGDHCRKGFCKARANCPALAKFVRDTVGADFETLADEAPTLPADEANPDLAAKMKACDAIEDWIKAVRAEVERRLLAGDSVQGFKLVQGRQGARAWSDEAEAEKMLKSFRLKLEEMYSFKLISPTAAEKTLKDSPRRWAKVAPLISRADGKPSVAPESDKRPALVITPTADAFETLPDSVEDLV